MADAARFSLEGEAPAEPNALPKRKRPAHCVLPCTSGPTIVFLTVCTKNRKPWLADKAVHELFRIVWREASDWQVGRYVIMPDHMHLFAGPAEGSVAFDRWVRFWKSRFSTRHGNRLDRWQSGYWDRRLRSQESYDSKWEYVRNNPVRHSLVAGAEDWPFQGELNVLAW